MIRTKEVWSYEDLDLVDKYGNITWLGLTRYWQSVDKAVAFNAKKRDIFLAKSICGGFNGGSKKLQQQKKNGYHSKEGLVGPIVKQSLSSGCVLLPTLPRYCRFSLEQ